MGWFSQQPATVQAVLAGTFTWAATLVGAGLTLGATRRSDAERLPVALGAAAGVMVAACFWSLLAPSIELAAGRGRLAWVPAALGLLLGAAFIGLLDRRKAVSALAGRRVGLTSRTRLLVTAVALHNVPEGLAIGVAFGAVTVSPGAVAEGPASLGAAIALTIGIALQNLPEGGIVAAPLRSEGYPPWSALWQAQLSAVPEPLFAGLGAIAVVTVQPLLPYALGFAAGAMLSVVVQELVPRAQEDARRGRRATTAAVLGFVTMMVLDVSLG